MFENRRISLAAAMFVMVAASARAQLPGAPVLQNAWVGRGFVGAFNLGGGSGEAVYAGALSWAPASGWFQVSAGVGGQTVTGDDDDDGGRVAYGFRVAMPIIGIDRSFGFGVFAGVGGGGPRGLFVSTFTGDTLARQSPPTRIPVGASFGWRRLTGNGRGLSLYAAPSCLFLTGEGAKAALFRAGLGADLGLGESFGLTGGLELGQNRSGVGGPSGTIYGLGISYAFGRP